MVKVYPDGKRSTTLYSKYLMEKKLGRELVGDETVDHINNDKTDDRIENLQILSRSENSKKSAVYAETLQFICPICKREFTKTKRRVRHNQLKQGKSGPYCSKRCAGYVGK